MIVGISEEVCLSDGRSMYGYKIYLKFCVFLHLHFSYFIIVRVVFVNLVCILESCFPFFRRITLDLVVILFICISLSLFLLSYLTESPYKVNCLFVYLEFCR